MYINKFIGCRQSGKTTFLINIATSFLGQKPEEIKKMAQEGFPVLGETYKDSYKRVLIITPYRDQIRMFSRRFETQENRVIVKCPADINAGGCRGLVFDMLLIDNFEMLTKEESQQIFSLFKGKNTLCYITINGESKETTEEINNGNIINERKEGDYN